MANYGQIISVPGLLAGADLSAYQYRPVKLTDGQAASVAGVGSLTIAKSGTSVIAAGAYLTCNTTGLVATTSDNALICGRATQAATAAGDLIMITVLAGRY